MISTKEILPDFKFTPEPPRMEYDTSMVKPIALIRMPKESKNDFECATEYFKECLNGYEVCLVFENIDGSVIEIIR